MKKVILVLYCLIPDLLSCWRSHVAFFIENGIVTFPVTQYLDSPSRPRHVPHCRGCEESRCHARDCSCCSVSGVVRNTSWVFSPLTDFVWRSGEAQYGSCVFERETIAGVLTVPGSVAWQEAPVAPSLHHRQCQLIIT